MIKIAPSILSADFAAMGEETARLEGMGADYVHIDVMDGMFVPNMTFGMGMVSAIRKHTKLPLDVHLMIHAPERYIDAYVDAGADIITFHTEASTHAHRTLQAIKARGIRGGVALNPATPHGELTYILDDCDMVLVMSVNPGYGGQAFIPGSLDKIRAIRGMAEARGLHALEIEVDGGINRDTAKQVIAAGANVLVAGSGIYAHEDRAQAVKELRGL